MIQKITYSLLFMFTGFIGLAQPNKTAMKQLSVTDWEISQSKWQTAESVRFLNQNKPIISKGNDLLLGQNGAGKLFSVLQAEDVKLKFEFQLSPNSETVFYIMGKYGILLSNSYARDEKYIGSIIRPNGTLQQPTQNLARATGLWQTIEIIFSKKTDLLPANFEKVMLNGTVIHENYYLPAPSAKSPLENDVTKNPFVFDNISGSIAIRNFEYLAYANKKPISISDLKFTAYETHGWDKTFEQKDTKPVSGKAENLSPDLAHPFNNFKADISGKMLVDETQNYTFMLDYQGVASLRIDGKEVAGSKEYTYRIPQYGTVNLTKGIHDFTYKYQRIWWKSAFGLFVSGSDFRPYPLHPANALPAPDAVKEVSVNPSGNYEMIRSFMLFNNKKRTHVISVGSPDKIHYSFDLNQGTPLYFWRGEFADVTEMWFERGEPQLLKPKGLVLQLSGKPTIFQLETPSKSSPDSLDAFKEVIFKKYQLDDKGNPTFIFEQDGAKISQKFTPENNGLRHEISLENGTNFYVKLAEGKQIGKLDKETYLIDNQYVRLDKKVKPIIRDSSVGKEILLPINGKLNYWIGW